MAQALRSRYIDPIQKLRNLKNEAETPAQERDANPPASVVDLKTKLPARKATSSLKQMPLFSVQSTKQVARIQQSSNFLATLASTTERNALAESQRQLESDRTNLLQQISSSARGSGRSKRRLVIGFEANKSINGNFLRKLDRMIAVSARPKSLA